jgi:ATP-dependent helicase YprA (DUF1998 family)
MQVYDGDTEQSARASIRDRAQLLITNPDMLHMSILPIHSQFARCCHALLQHCELSAQSKEYSSMVGQE